MFYENMNHYEELSNGGVSRAQSSHFFSDESDGDASCTAWGTQLLKSSVRMMVDGLPTFSGLPHESVFQFIRVVDATAERFGLPSCWLDRNIPSKLRGDAARLVAMYDLHSWDKMKLVLGSRFAMSQVEADILFRDSVQYDDESVSDFARRVQNAHDNLILVRMKACSRRDESRAFNAMLEDELVFIFSKGLISEIRDDVESALDMHPGLEPVPFSAVRRLAVMSERRHKMSKKIVSQLTQENLEIGQSSSNDRHVETNTSSSSSVNFSEEISSVKSLFVFESKVPKKIRKPGHNVVCFACKSRGHLVKNCVKRQAMQKRFGGGGTGVLRMPKCQICWAVNHSGRRCPHLIGVRLPRWTPLVGLRAEVGSSTPAVTGGAADCSD